MTLKVKINWINLAQGATADERGYWQSMEGRFSISPKYRHTIYPDSYSVRDNTRKEPEYRERNFDTVRECKEHAVQVLRAEIAAEIDSGVK